MKDLKELLTISDKISKNSVVYYSQQNVLRIIEEFGNNIKEISYHHEGNIAECIDYQLIKAKQYSKL